MSREIARPVPPPITPETFAQVRAGDKEAKAAIVDQYGRFVHMVANRFARSLPRTTTAIDKDDLVQVGMEGLLKAAEIYDPERGKFLNIASHYVAGRIRSECTSMRSTVRVPSHTRSMVSQVEALDSARYSMRGPSLSDEEIAEMFDIPEKGPALKQGNDRINVNTLRFARLISDHMGSLDRGYAPHQDMSPGNEYILDERAGLGNVTGEPDPTPDSSALVSDIPYFIGEALSRLDSRERQVIERRFGLEDEGAVRTLQEIGDELDISREEVRKIEVHALEKLRRPQIAPRLRTLLDDE